MPSGVQPCSRFRMRSQTVILSRLGKILAADPREEFEGGTRRFLCREYVIGWIERSAANGVVAREAYAKARPCQQAYVDKWPDDPNPLMLLAVTDAAVGRKDDAIQEASQAVARGLISQDTVEWASLAEELVSVYVLVGEREQALRQLEVLEKVPRALNYGYLSRMPLYDALRGEPRFQSLLARLGPLPIENRNESSRWFSRVCQVLQR